ncbi:MAG: Fe2+-dependent dioxygenase [Methylobacillus sp.]|jgi:PKHD-type hydroxylase|nr:Fe2+-dependent dioxygenase [Methylobacillus sp.]
MLLQIPDLLTTDEIARARQLLSQADWADGRLTAGMQAAHVKNNKQLPEDAAQLPELRHLVLAALNRSPLFFAAALPLRILPPFFNRYGDDANFYGAHVDGAMRLHSNGSYVRADVSATLFLSEPDEYEGGELLVEDTFGSQRVKLPAGHLVVYPSTSVHQVTPVTHGVRLASFMFIQSMVRDAQQRRMLFDMDMALLQLRQSVGETDKAVVSLTGTYHNLLRLWAES